MAKKKASDTVADRIAEFIGTAMGDLMGRKDTLMRQLQEVEAQIGEVRERVAKQFGQSVPVHRGAKKSARKAAKKARVISAKTRAKMAAAAKKRWAKAKKAARS